jgi:hypothetical protein
MMACQKAKALLRGRGLGLKINKIKILDKTHITTRDNNTT